MMNNFREFWFFYLREHSLPATRRLHVIGTSSGLILLMASLFLRSWPLFILAALLGYGLAWYSHFFIEKNRPASFKKPFWSLIADLKMLLMTISGELAEDLKTASRPGLSKD